jgi:hypothetical protein
MNSSDFAGSRSWQSASLPGSEATSIARLAGGLARGGCFHHLADDDLRLARMLLEPGLQSVVHHAFDHRPHLGGDELVLGLRGELRVRHLDGEDGGETLATVVAGERDLLAPGDRVGVAGDLTGERAAETGKMRAAVALRDVVGEGEHRLVVAVVPPQRGLDADAVALGLDDDGGGDERSLVAVEIAHERLDAALVAHFLALLDRVALVAQHDVNARIEERELAQPVLQRGEVELRHAEGLAAGQKRHLRADLVVGCADDRERSDRLAVAELHGVFLAVAPDGELEPSRQRVDDRDADSVQAAGDLVGVLVEFSPGVELRHDDFGRRHAFALVNVGGNAAAVVAHRARAIGVQRDHHFLGEAGERLVDRVVDDLVDHVVEAGAVVGVADIHARPLAHRIEALEDLDRPGVVFGRRVLLGFLADGFGHSGPGESVRKIMRDDRVVSHEKWGSYSTK